MKRLTAPRIFVAYSLFVMCWKLLKVNIPRSNFLADFLADFFIPELPFPNSLYYLSNISVLKDFSYVHTIALFVGVIMPIAYGTGYFVAKIAKRHGWIITLAGYAIYSTATYVGAVYVSFGVIFR